MEKEFIKVGKILRQLRESAKMMQIEIAALANTTQTAIFRYESGISFPTFQMLIWYADYFDVSLDYICGRTDNPQGKIYECKPKFVEDNKELKLFVEMCFDPNSAINARLKNTMLKMLEEQKK